METSLIKLCILFVAFGRAAFRSAGGRDEIVPKGNSGRLKTTAPISFVRSKYSSYPSAAVTTNTNICSSIGIDVLRDGGSAVDAAIAAQLCVGLVNCQSSGIGGGHFATIFDTPKYGTRKELMTIIARERAPLAADQDMFINDTAASSFGGRSIAVPGEISGFYAAWKEYGRLPWSRLFQPAIRICFEGFRVERSLANAVQDEEEYIRADENLSELFVKSDGSLVRVGDVLINKKMGRTLQIISNDPLSFYKGELALAIVLDILDYNGIISLDDLDLYKALSKPPIAVNITNGMYSLYNPPPPASGVVLDFILNVLDGYNLTWRSVESVDAAVLTYQRIVESFKFAYAKRSQLGDEEFVDVSELMSNLTSDTYAESIRQQIDDDWTHDVPYYGPTYDVQLDKGTSHLNVLAPDGSAVSLTSTVNTLFGSKCRGSRTGIIFNNEMDDFSTPGTVNHFGVPSSPSNYIAPQKMPMSSMAPTIVIRRHEKGRKQNGDDDAIGDVVFVVGASGGTKITTETSFVTLNSLWLGMNLLNSTDIGRPHHQLSPNQLLFEAWMDHNIVEGLEAKNHTTAASSGLAVVNAISNRCRYSAKSFGDVIDRNDVTGDERNCVEAISDGRKGGIPAGY